MKTNNSDDLKSWLQNARKRLEASIELPGLESQILAAHVLKKPRAWVLAHGDFQPDAAAFQALNTLLMRRLQGEPLPYLIGEWEFFGLSFRVSPAVLIPRPETELLVEQALAWLEAHPARRRAADIGTGSGCIAVSLAKNVPGLQITAADRSPQALYIARQNTARHAVSNQVFLLQADLLTPFGRAFDLVCANLPYIPSGKIADLEVAAHEPLQALDGGADGLDLIRRLLLDAKQVVRPGGALLLEIEAGQGELAAQCARQILADAASIQILNDLSGKPRLLKIQL